MLKLRPEETLHKSYLNRLLMEIVDQPLLAQTLAFKGGTCAAMLGYLNRFSVDLDFDVLEGADKDVLRKLFRQVFIHLGLNVSQEFENEFIFQLSYSSSPRKRSSIKVSAVNTKIEANQYRVQYYPEVDRLINSQTIETMFANKLVAVTDKYAQHGTITGRDIYDIHHFFTQGYGYHQAIIRERTGITPREYLGRLIDFIKEHITETIIYQDLNSLLSLQQFHKVRKTLILDTLYILARERDRLEAEEQISVTSSNVCA
jgi:predicted nucleotidyltransferase component of viral defense system